MLQDVGFWGKAVCSWIVETLGGGEVRGLDYRSADKSLARPGRKKLMHVSEWREFPSAPCLAEKRKFDSSRLDVVEIARVPNTLPSLFPSWSC